MRRLTIGPGGDGLPHAPGGALEALSRPPSPPGAPLAALAGTHLNIHSSSDMCAWRAATFQTKEPHTLRWLQTLGPDDVLYDIGANIGVYSLFAASRGVQVLAFEPEAKNYAELCKNIVCNGLQGRVRPFLLGVGTTLGLTSLFVSDERTGGSCHSVGYRLTPNLKERTDTRFEQPVFCMPMDDLVSELELPAPTAVKVDVDGLEHDVLESGATVLQGVRTVIVELSRHLEQHRQVIERLRALGLEPDLEAWREAQRPDGPFEGTGECVFTRSTGNVEVRQKPSPDANFVSIREGLLEGLRRGVPMRNGQISWLELRQAFRPDDYRTLLNWFPDAKSIPLLSSTRRVIGYPERHAFLLGEQGCRPAHPDAELNEFWGRFYSRVLAHPSFRETLLRTLGLTPNLPVMVEALLAYDFPGYSIGPHTDRPHRACTMLVYLPELNASPDTELGTTFYGAVAPDPMGEHHASHAFNRVATVPYAPNAGLAFARTDWSYHGVEQTKAPRRSLQVIVKRR